MYAPAYGYGPAPLNPPNHGAPPGSGQQLPHNHNPHPHQQQPQSHLQPGQQQPQQMMYNPLQYVQPGPGSAPHQSPYNAAGPAMLPNAGGMGMMQNNGMAHVPPYQTPYSSSPYGGNMPSSTAPNLPPNFMPTTSGAPSFGMNAPNMNPQHQAQRMQPPPPSSTPTQPGPRVSPFPGAQQNTPPSSAPVQSQFSTPQAQAQHQTQSQTPNNTQQAQTQSQGQAGTNNTQQAQTQSQGQAGTILTPQTPNFPPGAQGGNAGQGLATPLSPGSEAREKDTVTVLLEINKHLLLEVMRLQAAQAEAKKMEMAAGSSQEGADKAEKEKEKAEKAKPSQKDYLECMRRLQANLAYLAAIADRSHKPSSQIPPHPAIMSAPPLTPRSSQPTSPKTDTSKKEDPEEFKLDVLGDDHSEALREQYKKLQALFPNVDPKKDPPIQNPNAARQQQQAAQMNAARQQQQSQNPQAQGQSQSQVQGQGGGQAVDPNAQHKLQNDLMRQKMMQAQQAQQQNMQQMAMAQGGGMQGMGVYPGQMQQQQNR